MKRRVRHDRPTRQAQILETSARIFCEKGFDRASMGEISAALGLTKAGVYHHINSKEELLFEIMSYGMDLFEQNVLSKVTGIKDPLQRLRATLRGHVLLVTRDRPKEVMGTVLGSPVVAQLDSPSDVRSEATESVDNRVIDRLEGSDPVSDLGDMGPGFSRPVIHTGEYPHAPVVPEGAENASLQVTELAAGT